MTLYEKVKHLLAEGFEVGEIAFSLGISCDLVQRVKNLMDENKSKKMLTV